MSNYLNQTNKFENYDSPPLLICIVFCSINTVCSNFKGHPNHLFYKTLSSSIKFAIFSLAASLWSLSLATTLIAASCLYKLVASSSLLYLKFCLRRCVYKINTSISFASFSVSKGTF